MNPVPSERLIKEAAHRMGISIEDMQAFFGKGTIERYEPEAWLFHESTPRQWAGVIIEGEIAITRSQQGQTRHVAVLGPGALISESALLDELPHSTGAVRPKGRFR